MTYNVTLWRFHVNNVAVESQKLFLCTVVDLYVTVNRMKRLIVAMNTSQWISLQHCIVTKISYHVQKK